jgi:hypothetical protein
MSRHDPGGRGTLAFNQRCDGLGPKSRLVTQGNDHAFDPAGEAFEHRQTRPNRGGHAFFPGRILGDEDWQAGQRRFDLFGLGADDDHHRPRRRSQRRLRRVHHQGTPGHRQQLLRLSHAGRPPGGQNHHAK